MNQYSGNIIPSQMQTGYGMKKYVFGMVNNRDEAMIYNVPIGFCAYIFNVNDPEFYVKDNANLSGQCTFTDYIYKEKPIPQPQVNNNEYVTKADFDEFTQNILNAIQQQQKGDGICG
ncbi:MAG: hypothetical protein IKZ85_05945 [Pseudobutyrivibrio sp.]|nr:hypothetical protein [Pseudobutyrivibrio sp.]